MGYLHNQLQNEILRKKLRSKLTFSEQLFWNSVRANQLGVRFRRQHGFGDYVLDFYCAKVKLAIEIDGDYHLSEKVKLHDERRTRFLTEFGIRVVRFRNKEILEDLDKVVSSVKRYVLEQTSPMPSPLQGEG